jgi:hypothetical protein
VRVLIGVSAPAYMSVKCFSKRIQHYYYISNIEVVGHQTYIVVLLLPRFPSFLYKITDYIDEVCGQLKMVCETDTDDLLLEEKFAFLGDCLCE